MDTVRAVTQIAETDAQGRDGSKTAAAAHLNRISPGTHVAAWKTIAIAAASGLRPDEDRATQTRIANAVDRHVADAASGATPQDPTRSILLDVMLQEAAAARLVAAGGRDPLAALAESSTPRDRVRPQDTLRRAGVGAHAIFDRASQPDMEAIAGGRFDRITAEHTRFAVATQLRLGPRGMSSATPEPTAPLRRGQAYPGAGMAKGPVVQQVQPLGFGRRNAAER